MKMYQTENKICPEFDKAKELVNNLLSIDLVLANKTEVERTTMLDALTGLAIRAMSVNNMFNDRRKSYTEDIYNYASFVCKDLVKAGTSEPLYPKNKIKDCPSIFESHINNYIKNSLVGTKISIAPISGKFYFIGEIMNNICYVLSSNFVFVGKTFQYRESIKEQEVEKQIVKKVVKAPVVTKIESTSIVIPKEAQFILEEFISKNNKSYCLQDIVKRKIFLKWTSQQSLKNRIVKNGYDEDKFIGKKKGKTLYYKSPVIAFLIKSYVEQYIQDETEANEFVKNSILKFGKRYCSWLEKEPLTVDEPKEKKVAIREDNKEVKNKEDKNNDIKPIVVNGKEYVTTSMIWRKWLADEKPEYLKYASAAIIHNEVQRLSNAFSAKIIKNQTRRNILSSISCLKKSLNGKAAMYYDKNDVEFIKSTIDFPSYFALKMDFDITKESARQKYEVANKVFFKEISYEQGKEILQSEDYTQLEEDPHQISIEEYVTSSQEITVNNNKDMSEEDKLKKLKQKLAEIIDIIGA